MKKIVVLPAIIVVIIGCCAPEEIKKIDDHFYSDLSSENNRLAAKLYLDQYNENLESLTYDAYIDFLSLNEAPSAGGLAGTVRKSDRHFFKARKTAFVMLLYFSKAREIVGDNSRTAFIDTVIYLNANDTIPDLGRIADSMKF